MRLAELTAAGNEASDLLRVHDEKVLETLGARSAYWTVLDEGPVERCLALLVESADGRWTARPVEADAGDQAGRTEDAEALAWHDGWVYVFGSHFGSKRGPLRPKRAFMARFRESLTPRLDIVKHRFALHRAVNDAVAAIVEPPADAVRDSFVTATLRRGHAKGKKWTGQLQLADHPINVEAAAFTSAGTLLIGLRWPVSAFGEPLLVEAGLRWRESVDVIGVHRLRGAGQGPLGVRALSARADESFDVIVGSIDALDKDSVLLDNHPEARDVTCKHYRFTLGGGPPELIADLAPLHHVEGVSEWNGRPLYVTDEAHQIALYTRAP